MSAVANIVINDAQATPVAHTFIPLGSDRENVWWWEDQSASNALGYWRISAQLVRPAIGRPTETSGARVNRVKIRLYEPVLETLGTADNGLVPPPTVAFIPRCDMDFVMSERASLQNRKDLRKMAYLLLNEVQVIAMVETLQGVF